MTTRHKPISKFLVALAIIVAAACASEDTPDHQPLEVRLADILSGAARDGASGILRVTRNGEVLFESGFGSASCVGEEAVSPDHLFMIGSITKEFTQVLGFVLEEQGFISLDGTVNDYIPDFTGEIGAVTVEQLMHHTGGLPDLVDEEGRSVPYSIDYDYIPVSRDELLERAQLARLTFEPGTGEEYSNLGYQVLAAIYEIVTGESFQSLLQEYIYQPAEMRDTGFWFQDIDAREFTDGCGPGGIHWGNPIDDAMWGPEGPSWNLIGAGGLLSTAESLARFFDGIGSGAYFETEVQSERYKNDRMVYSNRREQLVMGPAGSNGVFNAAVFWADESRFSVVLITNRSDHAAEDGLFGDVVRMTSE